MWVFINDAFLSIIEPPPAKLQRGANRPKSRNLLVRGRFPGDIEKVFPHAEVTETPERDYRFRATISREAVAEAMAEEVRRISYTNFKGSVDERERHDDYLRVWGVMKGAQERVRRSERASQEPEEGFFPFPRDDTIG